MCHYLVNTDRKQAPNLAETSQTRSLRKTRAPLPRWTTKPFASPAHPPAPPLPTLARPPRWVQSIRRPPPARIRARRAVRTRRSRTARARARAKPPSVPASRSRRPRSLRPRSPGASETCGPASRAAGGALEAAAGGPAHEERRVQGFSQGRWSKWRRSAFQ